MAGGKQSPRQKMINLMYLVFLAMMAMNMGKEVLSAFGLMNEKLADANQRATEKNAAAYANLATKAAEQAKQYGEAKEKTDELKVKANELYSYLEDLKGKMTADIEDKKDYELMDKSAFLDSYFFESGTISPNGKEFVSKIDEFRKSALDILGETDLGTVVESRFDTNPVKNREGLQLNWLNYNYEGFPLIASLTKLTQIQADVKATESDALSALLQGEMESAVSMTNYDAMVVFDKNAYYPGEKLSGKIVLGKNDPNLTAEKVVINGEDWPDDKIKAGQVILDGPAGSVGDREIKGSFFFKENDSLVEIPIKGGYSVIPRPNEAVISADKMNAVYRGLSNPMTISMPGVPSNKVSASAAGLRRVKGDSYMMTPGSGSEVTIRVTGTLPDGKKVSSNKKFRIKDIPPAVGAVRGEYGTVSMPKASAGNVSIGALLPDFLFDLKLNVTSFKVKVPGQPAVPVTGNRINARAKAAIAKARRDDVVNIFDIQATVSGSGAKVKKVVGVGIKISN
ncbi:protein involved in gliding motility GldM [Tenacibaculum skagerrakense]|uniref:Protein involved in gliding motility GldM n=1 Tax=Tenacibaculum skagerrakense TaxID=186571 RepID=A0A4R2P1H4_9FLAO|nr:gliding motility protein GldM [Tenacibaculum skagerrakense]TCP28500.1 protein involved in gliding motility GldM [Tenacibaculum skagerrakense]